MSKSQVRPSGSGSNQLRTVQLPLQPHHLEKITSQLQNPLASTSAANLNSNVVIDVQQQVANLYPWEMTKHFHHAVREGDAQFVRAAVLAKPSLIDSLDERLACALSYAIKYRRLEVLQLLIRKGAALNLRGQEGTRPIHAAATFNVEEAMQLLLRQKGIKIDVTDDKGQTALHVACRRSHVQIARLLLEFGADVLKQEKDGVSALHQPARNGSLELCELLLSSGANVDTTDNNGLTPVMVASIEGRLPILKRLLQHSTEKNEKARGSQAGKMLLLELRDNDGSTALHHATQNRQVEILAHLLEAGANANAKRNDGNTPLHIAASLGYQDVVEILLSNGANPCALDKKKRTPLHECGLNNQPEIARQLIIKGAAVDAADADFMSPLHWACKRGHRPVADVLLEFRARLDGHDVGMRTPLHWAVIEDNDGIVERLLEAPGVETVLNKQDMFDKTPLHYATERGCTGLARRLVGSGADCTVVDGDERRPATWRPRPATWTACGCSSRPRPACQFIIATWTSGQWCCWRLRRAALKHFTSCALSAERTLAPRTMWAATR
ncbi:hypothetical protein BOX15_Mlig032910g2 [Macrostomum lignano]|uniref:Uncharacterized protein n=1 Tax=Macrostomum lignano TaxID=282301 RepID=A0A267E200_9PLAT|nr:hypothetical protein BOX15_Mlig032910g2 [Macrostomum lignano]